MPLSTTLMASRLLGSLRYVVGRMFNATKTPAETIRIGHSNTNRFIVVLFGLVLVAVPIEDAVAQNSSTGIQICPYDSGNQEDGDTIYVEFDGEPIFRSLELTFNERCVEVSKQPGRYSLLIRAINTGSAPPNTASVTIRDSTGEYVDQRSWVLDTSEEDRWVVVVSDDDITIVEPGVRVSLSTMTLEEGSRDTYTVELESEPSGTVTVRVSGDSTAVTVSPATLIYDAQTGPDPQTVTVMAVDDNIVDGGKTVVLAHTVSGYGNITAADDVRVSVNNDDMPQFTVAVDTSSIDEDSGTATVTVSTGGVTFASDEEIILSIGGTATNEEDYRIREQTLTLPAGETSVSTTVTAVDDTAQEDSETITIAARHAGAAIGETQTITVTDDDLPQFTVAVDASSIDEDGGTATVTVSTGGVTFAADEEIVLSIGGTATNEEDYGIREQTLILPAGETSVSTTVTAVDDTAQEDGETITIAARHAGAAIGETQTITVIDDDIPQFTVAVDTSSIDEDGGTATVTVSTGGVTFAADEEIILSIGGTATNEEDYGIREQTLILPAGETSVSTTVLATSDTVQEGSETITIAARHAGAAIGEPQTITVIDDDMPQFTVAVDISSIDEDGGTATVTVSTGGVTFASDEEIILSIGGTATNEEDYGIREQTLILPAGETSVSTVVAATSDTVQEGSETITIAARHAGAAIGETQTITVTDDDLPQFTVAVDATSIDEDGGTATVTVSTGGVTFAADEEITLSIGGTATNEEDYGIREQTLILPAGETSVSTVVAATSDTVQEGSETITIAARHAGAAIGESQTITVTDDDLPQFTVAVDATSIDEDGGTATVTVSTGGVTFAADEEITLSIGGTATNEEDYGIREQTLILPAGETSVSTVVTATSDTVQEGSETITITARHAGAAAGETQTITIIDEDEVSLSLTVDPASIDEDEGRATVTVNAVGGTFGTAQTITLLLGGTATEGTDYSIGDRELTLEAGQTSVGTTLTATMDTLQEDNETITITAQHDGEAIGEERDITIMEPEPETEPLAEQKERVEDTLEAVVTSTISNATANIGTRFSAARGGTAVTVAGHTIPFAGSALALAGLDRHSHSGLDNWDGSERRGHEMTLHRLLETSAFQVALAADGDGSQEAQPLGSLTVWGRVDRMNFDKDSNDDNRFDGELLAGYVGLDSWLDDRWLLGVAAAVNKVKAGYGLDDGELRLTMMGVHPYLRLAIDDLSEVWGILGVSLGNIQHGTRGESGSRKE